MSSPTPCPSAIENKNLRLLVPAPNLLDQDQIVEDWCSSKIRANSPPESPAPILCPHPPKDARHGRGRHFHYRLWRSVGAEIICDRVQALNVISKSGKLAVATTGCSLCWVLLVRSPVVVKEPDCLVAPPRSGPGLGGAPTTAIAPLAFCD